MSDEKNKSEEFETPWPKTEEELLAYIREALSFDTPGEVPEDPREMAEDPDWSKAYNDSADALWKCALAAFNYAAHQVGASGWQASYAELRFVGESRGLKGPFALLDANDMLYPQYDIRRKVEKYLEEWRPWAIEQAREKLAENEDKELAGLGAAPRVREHWEGLARG